MLWLSSARLFRRSVSCRKPKSVTLHSSTEVKLTAEIKGWFVANLFFNNEEFEAFWFLPFWCVLSVDISDCSTALASEPGAAAAARLSAVEGVHLSHCLKVNFWWRYQEIHISSLDSTLQRLQIQKKLFYSVIWFDIFLSIQIFCSLKDSFFFDTCSCCTVWPSSYTCCWSLGGAPTFSSDAVSLTPSAL